MAKIREYENSAEIATYLHVNDGEAYTKSYTAVNEDVKPDKAQLTKKVGGVKVKMLVEEDSGVQKDGSFYKKTVWNTQERDYDENITTKKTKEQPTESEDEQEEHPETTGKEPSGLYVLKNFVDKLSDGQTALWIVLVAVAIISAVALTISLAY